MDKQERKTVVYVSKKPNYDPPHEPLTKSAVIKAGKLAGDDIGISVNGCDELVRKLRTVVDSGTPIVAACAQFRREAPYSCMNQEIVQNLFAAAMEELKKSLAPIGTGG
jgi:hypothetical protein